MTSVGASDIKILTIPINREGHLLRDLSRIKKETIRDAISGQWGIPLDLTSEGNSQMKTTVRTIQSRPDSRKYDICVMILFPFRQTLCNKRYPLTSVKRRVKADRKR